jgi:CheY-like chemotaxis protein
MARILAIEDDDLVRATIKRTLEGAGHAVFAAADGRDGLQQFWETPTDLVLCDVFMPKKSGIATLRELRQISNDVPVIMMSAGIPQAWRVAGLTSEEYLCMTTLLSATRALDKPFKPSQLLALVAELMADRTN